MTRLAFALVVVSAVVVAFGPITPAAAEDADAVALLPLDADKNLEIYGQPVASEIARALVAGDIDVVVVGPKMAVPTRARLIVDGTIVGKGDAVVLSIRVRNPADGIVLLTLTAPSQGLANIDKAAADLSARVLPAVRERLAALHKSAPSTGDRHATDVKPPEPPKPRPLLVSVTGAPTSAEPLRAALGTAVTTWATAHHREPVTTEPNRLVKEFAVNTLASSGNDLGIAFEIISYAPELGTVPMAHARVRVRIASATEILFDRLIITDTVVGDRGLAPELLAARTAREVLDIVRPHLRRAVPSWR